MNRTILIIEDDSNVVQTLSHLIEPLHFDVTISWGILPMMDIKRLHPNVILLNYRISGGLGGLFCKKIKKNIHIPIILISLPDEVKNAFNEPCADSVLILPFDLDLLQEELRRLVN